MDRKQERQIDRIIDKQQGRQIDGITDREGDKWLAERQTERKCNISIDGVNRQTDRQMDGEMD